MYPAFQVIVNKYFLGIAMCGGGLDIMRGHI